MQDDVNGVSWLFADLLSELGVWFYTAAINPIRGARPKPFPGAFWWAGPSGRKVLAWNGYHYFFGRSQAGLGNFDLVDRLLPRWVKQLEADPDYPCDFLYCESTHPVRVDNGPPDPRMPEFVRRWNGEDRPFKFAFVTTTEFGKLLRDKHGNAVGAQRGDWTDHWTDGPGSSAYETGVNRGAHEIIGLEAWHPPESQRHPALVDEARRSLALYAEHTWGADRSISQPYSAETRTQQILKLQYASTGASVARMLRRDGLERMAIAAGGEEPHLLVYNPNPFPVRQSLRLPYLPPLAGAPDPKRGFGLEDLVPTGPQSHRIQRQDVVLSDLSDDRAYWTKPIEVQGLSFVTMSAADATADTSPLTAKGGTLSNGRVTLTLDEKIGGVASLMLEGVEYAGAGTGIDRMGVPVLERVQAGTRDAIFAPIDVESPDWNLSWDTKWKAIREAGTLTGTRAVADRGRAEVAQTFTLPNGDRAEVIYRLTAETNALEVVVIVDKTPEAEPHGLYLPLPVALGSKWTCDFETAGAAVRLDDEQLSYSSRGYVTTQRWIRIADGEREMTIACPDAPLWQVGGYTFGRHAEPDGRVPRERPTLIAWLTNNYWMTNFQADQGGRLRFRFHLIPGAARPLGTAARDAIAHAKPLAAHVFAGRGPERQTAGTLLATNLGGLILSRLEPSGDRGVAVTLLNPEGIAIDAAIGPGIFHPARAWRTSLAGEHLEDLSCENGEVRLTVPPRAWTRVVIDGR